MASPQAAELPKIKLHWLNRSRAQRILWLLEELKLPYEIEIYHRNPQNQFAPPELQKIHPLGKAPVIEITAPGATESVVLAESGFVVEYLLDHFAHGGPLLPTRYREGREGQVGGETAEWLRFKYFLQYAEGSLMPFLVTLLVTHQIKAAPVPFFIRPITNSISSKIQTSYVEPNLATHFAFLEQQVRTSSGDYLCGAHLTGADILMSFPLIAGGPKAGLTKERYPELAAYIERLEQEPGYKKAVEKIIELDGKFETDF